MSHLDSSVEEWAKSHPEVKCNLGEWEDLEDMVTCAKGHAAAEERDRIEKCLHDRATGDNTACPVNALRAAYVNASHGRDWGCFSCRVAHEMASVVYSEAAVSAGATARALPPTGS